MDVICLVIWNHFTSINSSCEVASVCFRLAALYSKVLPQTCVPLPSRYGCLQLLVGPDSFLLRLRLACRSGHIGEQRPLWSDHQGHHLRQNYGTTEHASSRGTHHASAAGRHSIIRHPRWATCPTQLQAL